MGASSSSLSSTSRKRKIDLLKEIQKGDLLRLDDVSLWADRGRLEIDSSLPYMSDAWLFFVNRGTGYTTVLECRELYAKVLLHTPITSLTYGGKVNIAWIDLKKSYMDITLMQRNTEE